MFKQRHGQWCFLLGHVEGLAPAPRILDFGAFKILPIENLTMSVNSHNNANVLKSLWHNELVQHTNLPNLSYQYFGLKTHILLYMWLWCAVYQYNSQAESRISKYVVLALTQLYHPQNVLLYILFIL